MADPTHPLDKGVSSPKEGGERRFDAPSRVRARGPTAVQAMPPDVWTGTVARWSRRERKGTWKPGVESFVQRPKGPWPFPLSDIVKGKVT